MIPSTKDTIGCATEIAQPPIPISKSLRYNEGKLQWSLVHWVSLAPLVEVLMFGAKKYAPDNWKIGLDPKEILDSTMRHLTAMMDGEKLDKESGLSHAGHIYCNMMFYIYHTTKQTKK